MTAIWEMLSLARNVVVNGLSLARNVGDVLDSVQELQSLLNQSNQAHRPVG